MNQTPTSVNDGVARPAVIEDELIDRHSHKHEHECMLMLHGTLELDVEPREPLALGAHQRVTTPHGVSHRPHARTDAPSR